MIVIDTGPVVAAANRKDDHHEQCVELLQGFPGPLLLPAPLITEIGYMLCSRAGSRAEADFLRDVATAFTNWSSQCKKGHSPPPPNRGQNQQFSASRRWLQSSHNCCITFMAQLKLAPHASILLRNSPWLK